MSGRARAPRSVLIISLRLIGDVILATPLVDMVHRRWPGTAIDVLVNRGTGEFLEKDPRVRTVIYHETPREKGLVRGRKKRGYLFRIFRRYEAAFNLSGSDRGAFAAFAAGRKIRFSFLAPREGWAKTLLKRTLLTQAVAYPPWFHIADLPRAALETLGERDVKGEVKVFWDAEDERAVEAALAPLAGSRYLVLHPFARWPFKETGPEILLRAAGGIARSRGWGLVMTSGPDSGEKERLAAIPHPVGLATVRIPGTLTLNGMACLIGRAAFYLGLDTAVTHVAASTGVPLVAIFGPTPLWMWGPWDNNGSSRQHPEKGLCRSGHIRVIQRGWDCVPCGRMGCEDSGASRCLEDLTADEVVAAADEVLGGSP